MSVILRQDNFNRANGALGTPSDGGSAWVQDSGTWEIDSTIRAMETTRGQQLICSVEASNANVVVEATISGGPGVANPGGEVGLVTRVANDANYILWLPDGRLFNKVGGGFGLFAGAVTTTVNAGDVLKITSDGANLHTGYINGSPVISGTDSNGATNTRHGLRRYNDTNQWYYDDFTIVDPLASAQTDTYPNMMPGIGF